MHTTIKDVVQDKEHADKLGDKSLPVGTHIITTTVEGDGPVALASDKATLSARIISAPKRTISGGFELQVAVLVSEPAAVVTPVVTPEDQAVAYFVGKGFQEKEAREQVAKFGVDRILSQKAKDEADQQKALDNELAAIVTKVEEKPAVAVTPKPEEDPSVN